MAVYLFILTSFKRPPLHKDFFLWAHTWSLNTRFTCPVLCLTPSSHLLRMSQGLEVVQDLADEGAHQHRHFAHEFGVPSVETVI